MTFEESLLIDKMQHIGSAENSFSAVVDEAFEKLRERQIAHSICRIQKMQENLLILEKELDEFLSGKTK